MDLGIAGRTAIVCASSKGLAYACAAALADAGARPLVAAPPGRLVSELQAKGGVWLDFPTRSRNPLTMLLLSRRLHKLIGQEQVDLVHARSRRAGWMAYGAVRQAKVPLVTSLSQISPGQSIVRQRYTSVMAKGDTVITGSKFAAATITSHWCAQASISSRFRLP